MSEIDELRNYFAGLDYKIIIVADGETRTHQLEGDRIVEQTPAGGVATAFDVVCQAADATYIARARTEQDREVVDEHNKVRITGTHGSYTLKRLFLDPCQEEGYYAGYSNQTLWPLCHAAFQRPQFDREWLADYREVNRQFAESIQEEIDDRTIVWINDYQLALVPGFLRKRKDTVVGMFWHIPWPTWEIFRILPSKREIMNSLLACDFIGFHRHYQARNFLATLDRELGSRIDYETSTVYVDSTSLRVSHLPMGIDVDVIRDQLQPAESRPTLIDTLRASFGFAPHEPERSGPEDRTINRLLERYQILLGVDRLDYTKGIPERLLALDQFFGENPEYQGKVVYLGIMSPTRASIPSYQQLRDEVEGLAAEINQKYGTETWEPLHMVYGGFTRDDVLELYQRAAVCLVTPLDDGMNLVSKEFVVAAGTAEDPGMLILSQFAGSAIDLGTCLLVNPYDRTEVADAIHRALTMDPAERRERIDEMVTLLEERNVYEWAISFVRSSINAVREQTRDVILLR